MLIPTFTIKLGGHVLGALVTVGRFDGVHPGLAVGVSQEDVLLHCPHLATIKHNSSQALSQADAKSTKLLNINRKVSALSSGNFYRNSSKDSKSAQHDTKHNKVSVRP